MLKSTKKLFGKHSKLLNNVSWSKDVNQPEKFAEVVAFAEKLSEKWPKELSRDTFKKTDLDKLMTKLTDYIRGSYRYLPGLPGDINELPSKPEYESVGEQFGRVANPIQDSKIVHAAALFKGRNINHYKEQDTKIAVEKYGTLSMEVIKYYADKPLAMFLFFLPTAAKSCETIAQGRKVIVLIDSASIDILKGVENVLLEIWDELGEGEYFDDDTVTRKLLSIVEASKL